MRLLIIVIAFILTLLPAIDSGAAPPAPWAGGPSGENSVIGGRSIRKPFVPEKKLVGKGTIGTLGVIAIRVQFDADGNGTEETAQGDDFMDPGNDKAFFESVLDSVARYYSDVSEGLLTLNFTVSGAVYSLTRDMGYYGDGSRGGAEALITDSVAAADRDVDFSLYDAVMILHAGVGEESLGIGDGPQYIWSQRVGFPAVRVDGVDISGGVVVPEKENGQNSSIMGIVAHEFGHELGLPDLYDVDDSSRGIGDWGLMGSGSWGNGGATPSELMAWSKLYLGWASVSDVSSDQVGYALPPSSEGNLMVRLNARGYPDSGEYFLVEYRRQASWDQSLPGQGLLVWHIDREVGLLPSTGQLGCQESRWVCNEVNADEGRKYVDLEEADGLNHLDSDTNGGDAQDPFSAGLSFQSSTNPNSNNNAGEATGVSITGISSPGSNMTFNLSLGFHVKSVSLVDANTLDVQYNRAAGSSPAAGNYTLSSIDGADPVNPGSASLQGDGSTVRLSFASAIAPRGLYRLTVGGEVDAGSVPLQFDPTVIDNPLGTNAAGVLAGHAIWGAAGSPFYVTGDLIIDNHLSLTVTEGAVVKIKKLIAPDQIDIVVFGLLKVQGTADNPVLITSAEANPAPGDWGTIRLRSEADDRSVISNAILEYGVNGLTLSSASPAISDSTFRSFSQTGVLSFGDSAPSITGSTFSGNLKGIQVQDSGSPAIFNNLFSGNSENGAVFFGTSAPTIAGNTFSQNGRGLSCWENSAPRITGNLITGNNRGVVCGNSARPVIMGNSFDGNIEIGLTVQSQVGALNPIIAGNNFINHSPGVGIYSFDNAVNVSHNYFGDNNQFKVGGENTETGIGPQLSNPVDPSLSSAVLSFRDSGYAGALSLIDPGSPLYIQLEGTDGDASLNSALVLVKSSATDTGGIYVHLNETGAATGVYRTATGPETQAAIGLASDQPTYLLGASRGETVTAAYAARQTTEASVFVAACVKGDADLSGSVDVSDLISLIRIVISLDQQPQTDDQRCAQDVDGSGTVDILDAIGAARILLEL